MEFQTPLNQAHSQVRKAENFLKTRKFDEAVELQDKIVELLREALAEARNAGLETSIRAQIDFHLKQKEVIRVKAARWEEFCLAVAALQVRMNVSGDGSADADGLQVETFPAYTGLAYNQNIASRTQYSEPSKRRSPCWNTSEWGPWWRPPSPASPAPATRCRRTTKS